MEIITTVVIYQFLTSLMLRILQLVAFKYWSITSPRDTLYSVEADHGS